MTENQIKTLQSLIGKSFMYNARNIKVLGFYESGDDITVMTDGHSVVFPNREFKNEMKNFLEVEDSGDEKLQKKAGQMMENNTPTINRIEKILSENIEKLQGEGGEKYINQAREITSTTNAIVKLNRLKLDMLKETRKLSNN